MKVMFNLLIVLGCGYGIVILLIFFLQSHLIYFPHIGREIIATPGQIGLNYENVEINTEDGETLHGWFVQAPDAVGTVLFLHGNAGNVSHRLEYLSMFHALRLNILIFDYRGYGQSSGTPSEVGTYVDADAAWLYLTDMRGIEPGKVVLFGESLGGAIAARLAAYYSPAILVLASTFTSVPELAETIYPFLPVRWIARFDYNTLEYLKSVTCPVFVTHSPDDEIVPFSHGQRLFHVAAEPKQFLTLSDGHNEGFIAMRDEWIDVLKTFIHNHLKP
ncbi:alpha/beta hydrolase [Nitrosomonas sp.]|uniref:alpha/beta hydrolase n=2 Tax=Nitrosomonas sp. TaxID=42353 RepID=UPI002850E055|nr:alpha/beta hydrolase [Nitrosomonas sp.]MDR4513357.1 alpha/beta hydrolase [Nitrosomonas sp.]